MEPKKVKNPPKKPYRAACELYWVNSPDAENADSKITANVLAAAVKKIEDITLVVCSEGASDTFARQTAPKIGAALDWPVVTSVTKITIRTNSD